MAEEPLLPRIGGMASRFGPWGLAAAAVGVDAYVVYRNFKGEQRRNRGITPERIRARGAGPQQAYARPYGHWVGGAVLDRPGGAGQTRRRADDAVAHEERTAVDAGGDARLRGRRLEQPVVVGRSW